MIYEYFCKKCKKIFEENFRMGEAPKFVKCACGKRSYRHFESTGFILKGGDWPSKTIKRNKQMIQANDDAGKRSKDTWGDQGPVSYDFGNGDVRDAKEVKKEYGI